MLDYVGIVNYNCRMTEASSTQQLDWMALTFDVYDMPTILKAVNDDAWQRLRVSLKGVPLPQRYRRLMLWLIANEHSERAKVQVTNYVNALRRGGMVPPK